MEIPSFIFISKISFDLKSDIESGVWDPLNPMNIIFSTEDGFISQLDARNFNSGYVFHTKAHEKSVTSVSMNSKVNGMLGTISLDGRMKIWDTTQIHENSPKLIANKPAKAVFIIYLLEFLLVLRENYIVDHFMKTIHGFLAVEALRLIL